MKTNHEMTTHGEIIPREKVLIRSPDILCFGTIMSKKNLEARQELFSFSHRNLVWNTSNGRLQKDLIQSVVEERVSYKPFSTSVLRYVGTYLETIKKTLAGH